jgi:flagellar motor switch protein FliN/FliY
MSDTEIPTVEEQETGTAEETLETLGIKSDVGSSNEVLENLASHANLDFLMDVPLQVTVELGRCKITIADLLKLSKGSVLELNKVAGESLDFRVNDRLVARGEAIVINDKFGIRLTDVISPTERVQKLK